MESHNSYRIVPLKSGWSFTYTKCFSIAQDLLRQILALRSTPLGFWLSPWPPLPPWPQAMGLPAGLALAPQFMANLMINRYWKAATHAHSLGGSRVIDPGWAWEGGHQREAAPCKQIWPVSQGTQGQPWLMPSKTSVMRAALGKAQLPSSPTNKCGLLAEAL